MCHKTVFNVTKITYNTYSCAISGMSREMMKMGAEIVPNVKTGKRRDIMVIFELFKLDNRTKVA